MALFGQERHWRRKRGGAGGCSPPERWTQGAAPPTNWCQWVSETKCEIKQPAVVHMAHGMAQKRIESFFARFRGEQQLSR